MLKSQLTELQVSREQGTKEPVLKPISQVEPSSYLGMAFGRLRRLPSGPSDGGSSRSSEDSSSDDDEGRPSAALTGRRKTSERRSRQRTKRVPIMKPPEPEKYNGAPDAPAFHKFMTEMGDYIEGYGLARFLCVHGVEGSVDVEVGGPFRGSLQLLFPAGLSDADAGQV